MTTEIDVSALPVAPDRRLLCPQCGEPVLLEITRHNFTPGRRGAATFDVEYDEPLDGDVEEYITDAYCRKCSWSYRDTDEENAEDTDRAMSSLANAVATLTQALQVAWWELGVFPYPRTPDDSLIVAAEFLARKFRVGQRLRFIGGGLNLRTVTIAPDELVDIQGQVGTVVETSRTHAVRVAFDAYPDCPISMFAADAEFESVADAALPTPGSTHTPSPDCQEFINWLVSQMGPEETMALQTLSPDPATPAQTAFGQLLRADTPHRRFLQALLIQPESWTPRDWAAIRAEFATQQPNPECPFGTPTRVWREEEDVVFWFSSDDDTWQWRVSRATGRFWLV